MKSFILPKYGLGCANRENLNYNMSNIRYNSIIDSAISHGFKYFDTAPAYCNGLSEHRLGNYFSDIPNISDYKFSTKVGKLISPNNTSHKKSSNQRFVTTNDYSYNGIIKSVYDSLNRLRLNKLDIIFIHDLHFYYSKDPKKFLPFLKQCIKALEKIKHDGLVDLIGLGENEYEVCDISLDYFKFDCFLIAGRYTLFEQTLPECFLKKCEKLNVPIILGGPLNSGLISNNKLSSKFYNYKNANKSVLHKANLIKKTCKKYKIHPVAAALQFPLFTKVIKTIIIGIQNSQEISKNIKHINTNIPHEFWVDMKNLGFIKQFCPIK